MSRTGFAAVALVVAMVETAAAGGGSCSRNCDVVLDSPAYVDHRIPVETRPAMLVTHVKPAVYGTVVSRQLVRGPTAETIVTPPTHRVITETVVVRPARTTWEPRRDHWGRVTMCRVDHPPVLRKVHRTVVVPGERFTRVTLPVYRYVERTVQIRRPETVTTYVPPSYTWINHRFHTAPEYRGTGHHRRHQW